MKGFIDEFNECITDLNTQLVEKDAAIKELGNKLSEKEKTLNVHKELLNTVGKQLLKEKFDSMKKDKAIAEMGKHQTKLSLELMQTKSEFKVLKKQAEGMEEGGEK